ncbi:MAG: SPOR domain-containing protein [Deltaproteobacteria bacterium]|nr:SPOR domain-containing protein [Deltaproteobacteria bacterium]
MKKIIFTIAIVMTCFIEPANCEENDTHSSSKSLKAITIQVSSHKKAENAQREINRLKDQGLDVFVDYEQVKDKGLWHRVYIGRFESREEATKYAKELVDKGIISGFWVKQKKNSIGY